MATTHDLLAFALRQHEAGSLSQAEAVYRQILQADPSHVDALHLLGMVAFQTGRYESAVQSIRQALRLHPGFAAAHNNLGIVLATAGQVEEAVASFRSAITAEPTYADAHNNLGIALDRLGRRDEAIACYQQALRLQPNSVDAHYHLGLALRNQGQAEAAIAEFQHVIHLKPDHAAAYSDLGNALADRGQPDRAIVCYQQAVRIKPDFVEAFRNLGIVLRGQRRFEEAVAVLQQALRLRADAGTSCTLAGALADLGRWTEAVTCFEQAIAGQPDFADAHLGLGVALAHLRRSAEAVPHYQRALRLRPNWPEAYANLGLAFRKLRQFDDAIASYRQALQLQPDRADLHVGLGNSFRDRGNRDEAIACYQRALALQPDLADAHNNLGSALAEQGLATEAAACFQEAVRLRPDYAEAHSNLANILREQGRFAEAVASYQHAVRLKPDFAVGYSNLCHTLLELGQWDDAIRCGQEAVRLRPDYADGHNHLANALRERSRASEAIASYQEALRLRPDFVEALGNLAGLYRDVGNTTQAEAFYQQALRVRPSDGLRVALATLLPRIYTSRTDIQTWRQRLTENLQRLQGRIHLDLNRDLPPTLFLLAYQGLNDRDLQAQAAALYSEACPALRFGAPHCQPGAAPPAGSRPIRVGFISYFFHTHSVGRHYAGLIRHLSRPEFHVTLFRFPRSADAVTQSLMQCADAVITLGPPENMNNFRRQIAEQKLDVLFFTDIGMDPWTYFLALARLAPVQCVTAGHPVTTGIPTIDYFISSTDLETADADAHYTERLVRLANLPNYFSWPALTGPPRTRRDFGLPQTGRLYLCVQTLFKIHPDFDDLAAGILRADPEGHVVLVGGQHEYWTELLAERFRHTIPEHRERVHFLPQQPYEQYLHMLSLADVLLDTPHFGGGTTTYQALAVGTPVVTLPGPFLRGRVTYACYRRMGVLDCVASDAADYIQRAVRLATDVTWRNEVRAKIAANRHPLFENTQSIRDLEQFFREAVARSRAAPGALYTKGESD
jgi:tetratricopeptide (TPR) repeat protein